MSLACHLPVFAWTHDQWYIDGAPAAEFLAAIRRFLENCYLLLG
jgi:hypothetical protein